MTGSYAFFVARRLVAAVVIAALVSAITFVMLHVLRPESFFDPRPLHTELLDYLWSAFTRFDLGRSRQPPFPPVGELIWHRLGADVSLFIGAGVFGVAAGVAGGVFCARHPRSLRARALVALATVAMCAPVYWTALVTILLFGKGIGTVVAIPLVDTGQYQPLLGDPIGWFGALLVPWMITGAPLAAMCLRLVESSMLESGGSDFIRTAIAKGLSQRRVDFRHTFPHAAAPTIAFAGAYSPLLVANALLVEQVFNIPGVFRYTTGAISNADYPLLQGMVLVGAVMVVLGNLAADVVLARLDPRMRGQ